MRLPLLCAATALFLTMTPGEATAQTAPTGGPATVESVNLSGPRFGITYLAPGVRDEVLERIDTSVGSFISQFGWHWETRLFQTADGLSGVTEWVGLVGGLEQSLFIPSLTWVVGIRTRSGVEVGVGPNLTPAGVGLAIGGGLTLGSGPIYFPLNAALVPSQSGVRVSLLTGFNLRRN